MFFVPYGLPLNCAALLWGEQFNLTHEELRFLTTSRQQPGCKWPQQVTEITMCPLIQKLLWRKMKQSIRKYCAGVSTDTGIGN